MPNRFRKVMTSYRLLVPLAAFLTGSLLSAPSHSQSDASGARTVGASVGYTDQEFNSRLDAPVALPMARISASFSSSAATIGFEYAQSLGDRDISERDATGAADRSNTSVNFEYRLGPSFHFLAGYSDTETSIRLRPRDGTAASNESYATDGYNVGLAYSLQMPGAGALRFSYIWTRFDGELELADRNAPAARADSALGLTGRFSPDASGSVAGVDWTVALSQSIALRVSAARHETTFELREDGSRFDLDQQDTRIGLGILIPL